ncbi:MAG TPA: ribonuclease E/G, partial [Clostridia bacterium]|nr:ribonuclease E/G [Clostridia bacterium]
VTTHITLPGRCLVLLPTVSYLGVSRKITDEPRRAELRQMASGLSESTVGWIVRTEGEQADAAAFEADAAYLLALWDKLALRASHDVGPKLLYSDADLAQRMARDLMGANTARCLVQGEADFHHVRAAVSAFAPEKLPCVEQYRDETPLLEAWDVERRVDKALARRVWLKSGGYLVIEPAEALTTIDVNTGKFVGKRSLSDTVFKTNCEAAAEIARQLRLRDLGGILLIDFIDMDSDSQRGEVLRLLEENARWDRGKMRIAGFTQQGLLELTRKKVHAEKAGSSRRRAWPIKSCGI